MYIVHIKVKVNFLTVGSYCNELYSHRNVNLFPISRIVKGGKSKKKKPHLHEGQASWINELISLDG